MTDSDEVQNDSLQSYHFDEESLEELVQNGSRQCNHRGCSNNTDSLKRAYCSVWHEFLDLVRGDLLYEGTRDE